MTHRAEGVNLRGWIVGGNVLADGWANVSRQVRVFDLAGIGVAGAASMVYGTWRSAWLIMAAGLCVLLFPGSDARVDAAELPPEDQKYLKERITIIVGENPLADRVAKARDLLEKVWAHAELIKILAASKDATARQAVVQALATSDSVPGNFVPPLLSLLGTPPNELGEQVIKALRRAKDDVMDKAQALAANEKGPLPKRLGAVRLLGRLPRRQAVTMLIKLLEAEKSTQVAEQIYATLENRLRWFGDLPAARTPQGWAEWDNTHLFADEQAWHEANVKALESRLREAVEEREHLRRTVEGLMAQAYHATPNDAKDKLLLAWLAKGEAGRLTALTLIHTRVRQDPTGGKPSAALTDRLLEMVADDDPGVREAVAWLLKELRDPKAVKHLLDRLASEKASGPRTAIVNALGYLGDGSTFDPLVGLLKPTDKAPPEAPAIRAEAAGALAQLAGKLTPEQRKLASQALQQAYQTLDASQVGSCQSFVSAMATATLVNPGMLEAFKQALGRPGDGAAGLREAAARGLGLINDPKAVEAVRNGIGDPHPKVRKACAEALAAAVTPTPTELGALEARIDPKTEPDDAVRQAAWKSILAIGAKVDLAAGLAAADRNAPKKPDDKPGATRFVDLMLVLEPRFAAAKLPPDQRAAHVERIGDALVILGRAVQAEPYFKKAVEARAAAKKPLTDLDVKYVSAILAGENRFDEATKFAASVVGAGAGAGRAPLLAQAFHSRLAAMAKDAKDAKAKGKAQALLESIRKHVPTQFGAEWKAKFDAIAQQLAPAAATKPAAAK